jgi:hypothetical protein
MKTIVVRDTKGRKVVTIMRFPSKRTPLVSVVDNPKNNFSVPKLPLD